MKSHLQVKVFSMSAEMSYIRRKEEQWKNRARYARQKVADFAKAANAQHVDAQRSVDYAEKSFWSLRHHREDMKVEARTTHLAYGFMKGRSYEQMEHICYGQLKGYGSTEPQWGRIEARVERFTKDESIPQDWMQRFTQWLEAAKVWYEGNKQRIEAFNKGRPARLEALKATRSVWTQQDIDAARAEAKAMHEYITKKEKPQEKTIPTAFSNASHHS